MHDNVAHSIETEHIKVLDQMRKAHDESVRVLKEEQWEVNYELSV